MTFEELDLDPRLLQATQDAGFVACTPVQEQTFVYSLVGADVAVQSRTGTGKTAAFLLTIYQLFLEQRSLDGRMALIIAPTRELADQIEKDAQQLGKYLDFPIASFYGGVPYEKQERALAAGVRVAIGTPGRLLDFADQRKLDLRNVGILVIDEADRLFDMGFIPDLRRLIRQMPGRDERITMLYSATLSTRVKTLAFDHMKDPAEITVTPERVTVDEISQELYHVARDRKFSLLLGILAEGQSGNALIFTNMKQTAYEVATRMQRNGLECEYIVGDRPQRQRQRLIDALKAGTLQYLVATDVAARGLHVEELDLVVNYDLPEYSENYVHRIGRTARAGRRGKAVSLACEEHVFALAGIEEFIRAPIPTVTAPAELYAEDASAGMRLGHYLRNDGRDERRERRGGDRSGARRAPRSASLSPAVAAASVGGGRAGSRTVAAPATADGASRPAEAARGGAPDAGGNGAPATAAGRPRGTAAAARGGPDSAVRSAGNGSSSSSRNRRRRRGRRPGATAREPNVSAVAGPSVPEGRTSSHREASHHEADGRDFDRGASDRAAAETRAPRANRPQPPSQRPGTATEPRPTAGTRGAEGGEAGDGAAVGRPQAGGRRRGGADADSGSVQERLDRYREKYGEEFKLAEPAAAAAAPKPGGLWRRLVGRVSRRASNRAGQAR